MVLLTALYMSVPWIGTNCIVSILMASSDTIPPTTAATVCTSAPANRQNSFT